MNTLPEKNRWDTVYENTIWSDEIIKIRTGKTKEELLNNYGIKAESGVGHNLITIYIDNYEQYSILVSLFNQHRNLGGERLWSLFYRGVKDSSFELKSSLRVSGLERYECRIITDLYNLYPYEFENCKSDFEMIAKMRHYGLPTRFIDFTRNPNVALWVACEEFNNKDGMVYLIETSHDVLPFRMAEVLCKFARFDRGFDMVDERALYDYISIPDLKYYMQTMWAFASSMFIEPPRVDKREVNQEAVFLAECNELYHVFWSSEGQKLETLKEDDYMAKSNILLKKLPNNIVDGHLCCGSLKAVNTYQYYNDIRIIISCAGKKQILDELNCRGINKAFMYPTIENSVDVIKDRYRLIDIKNAGEH